MKKSGTKCKLMAQEKKKRLNLKGHGIRKNRIRQHAPMLMEVIQVSFTN
jgi:hypothetical protein